MSWFYRTFIRPALFAHESEEIHNRTLAALGKAGGHSALCDALAAFYGQDEIHSREKAYAEAAEALKLVNLPPEESARVDGLGAAGLKKLELARALATQPKLLLADESLGGLDESEIGRAHV